MIRKLLIGLAIAVAAWVAWELWQDARWERHAQRVDAEEPIDDPMLIKFGDALRGIVEADDA